VKIHGFIRRGVVDDVDVKWVIRVPVDPLQKHPCVRVVIPNWDDYVCRALV
jgi:hypothetical protein